jgi:hypothetical protein
MTARPPTVGEVHPGVTTLSVMLSTLATELAAGKYAPEVAFGEHILSEIGLVIPFFAEAEHVAEFLLFVNKLTAGSGRSVPDGRGGAVTQSWIDDPRHALNADGTFKF